MRRGMSLGRVLRWWRPLRRSDGARTASTPLPHVCIVMYDYNRDMMIEEEIMNALAYGTVDNQPGSVAKLQQVSDFFKTSRWPATRARGARERPHALTSRNTKRPPPHRQGPPR